MAKNIVICCDGTGNGIEKNLSNVLKLYRMVMKDDDQVVFYDPGVGTLSEEDEWRQIKQDTKLVLGLATGYGLDENVLEAYRFIAGHYEPDDQIYMFGFSRGAYSIRVLAGLIQTIGLLRPDQSNLFGNGLAAFKQIKTDDSFVATRRFVRVTEPRNIPIKFIGVWDTVASVLVPRRDRFYIPSQVYLPYTRKNPSVEVMRHALAIDERRRMFRAYRWNEPQTFQPDWGAKGAGGKPQDIKQVWFAGYHSDIGGGYPEDKSGISKYPLRWMVDEAVSHGLKISEPMRLHLIYNEPMPNSSMQYAKPAPDASIHNSMNKAWKILEWLPKPKKYQDIPRDERSKRGWYLPREEPRHIEPGALVHHSVAERMKKLQDYAPVNMPSTYNLVHDPEDGA